MAASTGNDPALDSLLLRLRTETACRRGGALALHAADLDVEQCLVRLREKGVTLRWQPVSPTLMRHLHAHHEQRGSSRQREQLLRYRSGKPISTRRYDHLWDRLGNAVSGERFGDGSTGNGSTQRSTHEARGNPFRRTTGPVGSPSAGQGCRDDC